MWWDRGTMYRFDQRHGTIDNDDDHATTDDDDDHGATNDNDDHGTIDNDDDHGATNDNDDHGATNDDDDHGATNNNHHGTTNNDTGTPYRIRIFCRTVSSRHRLGYQHVRRYARSERRGGSIERDDLRTYWCSCE